MNNQTVLELGAINKQQDFRGYYKLKKSGLIVLLSKQSTQAISVPPTRTRKHKKRPVQPVKIIPHLQKMNKFEEQ